jgi:PadR family transcriptional regulator, regulatory protein AphA
MDFLLTKIDSLIIVEAESGKALIESEQDALDLASICFENVTTLLLINSGNLPDGFFDLKTGLAGAVMQKLVNYRIRAAAVIPSERISGRFGEMVLESNKGRNFRFFSSRSDALNWLTAGK